MSDRMTRVPPFTDEQAATIRSMALYWEELRGREDVSPLGHEVRQVLAMVNNWQLLSMAEFCVDPVRLAAHDLLAACEALLDELLAVGFAEFSIRPEDDDSPAVVQARAAIAKARGKDGEG